MNSLFTTGRDEAFFFIIDIKKRGDLCKRGINQISVNPHIKYLCFLDEGDLYINSVQY